MIERYCRFGLSPIILYKDQMLAGPHGELEALTQASYLRNYETLETFLSDEPSLRKEELRMIRGQGKTVTYNARAYYQTPGAYNFLSFDEKERNKGIDLMKGQLDICAEAESKKFLITSGPDFMPERREDVKKNLAEVLAHLSCYAKERGIQICIEPTERHRFKHQILGPTPECVEFIDYLHKDYGAENVSLMIDTAHCWMMEEDTVEDIHMIARQNLGYCHVGDFVNDPNSVFWGHTHPPVSVMGGSVDVNELARVFKAFFDVGYLRRDVTFEERPNVSYEMAKYLGVSAETSAQFAWEIADSAMKIALAD